MYSMPAARQASISDAEIGREASLMSVSPRQNFWKPPPVPEMPTVTLAPLAFWNSSATASVIGKTVLEPSTRMIAAPPPDAGCEPPPHAPAVEIAPIKAATRHEA